MLTKGQSALRAASPYSAVITREQFLFYEMRTTARLLSDGLSRDDTAKKIVQENLYQYPTERSLKGMARTCLQRLDALEDDTLVQAIANQPSEVAKQICLYAMMHQYRLVWDFMITVVGEKYRSLDTTFGKKDINAFLLRLQEQDDGVATWSDGTMKKIGQVLQRLLIENNYLDSGRSERLNPVLIHPLLENAIRTHGDPIALSAFNCFV